MVAPRRVAWRSGVNNRPQPVFLFSLVFFLRRLRELRPRVRSEGMGRLKNTRQVLPLYNKGMH